MLAFIYSGLKPDHYLSASNPGLKAGVLKTVFSRQSWLQCLAGTDLASPSSQMMVLCSAGADLASPSSQMMVLCSAGADL
jgi:hypothetical protein